MKKNNSKKQLIDELTDPLNNTPKRLKKSSKPPKYIHSLMDYIPGVSIQGYTTDGEVFYWNKASEKVYGYTEKEVIGRNIGDLIIPSDLKALFEEYLKTAKKVKKSGEFSPPTELLLLHKKGHLVPVYSIHAAICIQDKEPLLFCIDVDLSERKKAEKALGESESKFRSLFDLSPQAIALSEIETGRLVDVNSKFSELTQYDKEEILGKTTTELGFYSLNDRNRFVKELKQSGEILGMEMDFKVRNGSILHALMFSKIVFLGGVPLVLTIFINMTDHRRAEEKLRESEERYRILFDQAADLITIIDIQGNFLDLNKRFEEESGWKREEVIGKNLFQFRIITEASAERVDIFLRELLIGKEPPIFEVDGVRRDGGIIPYELRATPIIKHGKTVAVQAILRNIVERKHAQEKIIYMAYYDALTNLPNRYLLKDRLRQAIVSAKQHKRIVAVLFLDLDNFKHINDTLGHETGDQLLQGVADRLIKYVRQSDTIARPGGNGLENTVARMGGDEFTVLLTEIRDIPDASRVANRIINLFSQPFRVQGRDVFVSPSIGISIYPMDGADVDTLLKNADAAMYHAKDQGRKNFQFYTESLNTALFDRFTLENDLRKAMDFRTFQLYYQPQIDIHSKTICGIEALIRWSHPDKGLLPPSEFIPLSEEIGLITPLGEWILHTACTQNKALQKIGFKPMPITVNISGMQFRQSNFVETVKRILTEVQLDPGYLELELTENIFLESTEIAIAILKELKALGIRIAIDDFGTGYSSLSYLKRFPIDTLKIDRSFVKDIQTDPDDKAIVNAIITLAHSLNLHVVAEGVETLEQLEYLCKQGCDRIQGYLFSTPVPADSLTQLLKEEGKILDFLARGYPPADIP